MSTGKQESGMAGRIGHSLLFIMARIANQSRGNGYGRRSYYRGGSGGRA